MEYCHMYLGHMSHVKCESIWPWQQQITQMGNDAAKIQKGTI